MLNFEEEGKVTALSGLGMPPSAGFVPSAPAPAAESAFRRIKVEDKHAR